MRLFRIILIIFFILNTIINSSCKQSSLHKTTDNTSSTTDPGKVVQDGPKKPSFLWISIDTWRWDYIGVSGQGKVRTPTLDSLARQGVYEAEVLTPCPLTTPAHASMFTGRTPLGHGILDCVHYSLPTEIPVIAQIFKQQGYRTAAFISGETLTRRFGLDKGFDLYNDEGIAKRSDDDWMPATKDGTEITNAVLTYLQKEVQKPIFLFVHYFDLHVPYRQRPQFDHLYPRDRYAAQTAFVDGEIKKILDHITRKNNNNWRIMIVGDHGEGLGDHHEIGHGYGLYRSTCHVPFILYPKPKKSLIHTKPWNLIDLVPTIIEWFDFPHLTGIDGESLFQSDSKNRQLGCMSLLPTFMFSVNPSFGIREGDYMYIKHGVEELFDVNRDPDEMNNLFTSTEYMEIAKRLQKSCSEYFNDETIEALLETTLESTNDELARLESLGYLSGTIPQSTDLQVVDIRVLLDDHNALERVRTNCYESGNWEPMKSAYTEFLRKYPKALTVYKNFSKLLLKLEDYDRAIPVLEQAITLNPHDSVNLTNLGTLYAKIGKIKNARELLEKAVEYDKNYAPARLNLGIILNDNYQDPISALPHFKKFLLLAPHSSEYTKIKALVNRIEKAIEIVEKRNSG